MRRKKFFLYICFIFSLGFSVSLYAGGNPEVGLPKVDRLIKEKNYNAAIIELSDYMNEHPEDFDGAQRRIRKIIKLRGAYNDKALELLFVLANEPTNDQKKLEMINYLESLEKNPNENTQDFIRETKAAAQFTYYRAKLEEILNSGNTLIDEGQYVAAARKYEEGYVFYKQEFDEDNPPDLVSQVDTALGDIASVTESFEKLQDSFTASVSILTNAVSLENIATARPALEALDIILLQYSQFRNTVAEKGSFFRDTFEVIQSSNPQMTDNSFLPFAYRFTLGRTNANRFEGVLGAMDAQIDTTMKNLEDEIENVFRSNWETAYNLMESDETTSIISHLRLAGNFALLGSSLASAGTYFETKEDIYGVRDYTSIADRYSDLNLLTEKSVAVVTDYSAYKDLLTRIIAFSPSRAGIDDIRNAPGATVQTYNGFIDELNALTEKTTEYCDSVKSVTDAGDYLTEYTSWCNHFFGSVSTRILVTYRNAAEFQDGAAGTLVDERQQEYKSALQLLNGVSSEDSEQILFYPTESFEAMKKLKGNIAGDRTALLAVIAELQKVPSYVVADSKYMNFTENIKTVLPVLESLAEDTDGVMARANARILQANLAKQESDLRYSQAQVALRRSDFQTARDNLQRSREKINQSLEFQESSELRSESDTKLESLGSEITRLENEAVVREVRSLISSGKNAYYLGNIDDAEQIFTQAKARWSVTNIEENQEITNWLDIINTALSMKTGRIIPVTAPLYPQMSQLLSEANRLFAEGKVLMSQGKKVEAVTKLTEAKQQLQQLQLVYPLNQDAGLLSLRIDQVIDPKSFQSFFRQKVESVRANYRTEKQTSYSDLLDLYEINPSYPGIKKLLDEVEIYLGIKLPPPDPKAIARSAELTKSAQKIYDANTRSMFEVALDQLDEAIKLNPNNETAITLKDRVQTSIGGKSVAVLSAEDESKYQLAVQELQKGNKITASALVEQLLQNPKSRNSSKILDLKKRIDAQL